MIHILQAVALPSPFSGQRFEDTLLKWQMFIAPYLTNKIIFITIFINFSDISSPEPSSSIFLKKHAGVRLIWIQIAFSDGIPSHDNFAARIRSVCYTVASLFPINKPLQKNFKYLVLKIYIT